MIDLTTLDTLPVKPSWFTYEAMVDMVAASILASMSQKITTGQNFAEHYIKNTDGVLFYLGASYDERTMAKIDAVKLVAKALPNLKDAFVSKDGKPFDEFIQSVYEDKFGKIIG